MGKMSRFVVVVGLASLVGLSGCKKPKQFVLTRQQEAKVANAIFEMQVLVAVCRGVKGIDREGG